MSHDVLGARNGCHMMSKGQGVDVGYLRGKEWMSHDVLGAGNGCHMMS